MRTTPLPPPRLIQSPAALDTMLAELAGVQRCALDTESNSLYAYYHRVCLIQLSTDEADYVIDPLAVPDLSPFKTWIAHHAIEFTFHAAENDLLLLHRDHAFRFDVIFDTLWAARILGWQHPSLASLLDQHFGVQLDKRWQRTNWGKRPLSHEQLDYARLDTHYLLPLRDMLAAELQKQERWHEAQDIFAELPRIHWEDKAPPDIWRIRGVRDLEPQQLAVFKALFDWRQAQAQRRDQPPFKILRSETLLILAQNQPSSLGALRQVPGLPRRLPDSVARRLLQAIQHGQKAPVPTPPRSASRHSIHSSKERALYEKLRGWRRHQADTRGVDADVVLTNQVLMALARACPQDMQQLASLQLLGQWKLRTYGPALIALCRNTDSDPTVNKTEKSRS